MKPMLARHFSEQDFERLATEKMTPANHAQINSCRRQASVERGIALSNNLGLRQDNWRGKEELGFSLAKIRDEA
jgi:hypothetical protein